MTAIQATPLCQQLDPPSTADQPEVEKSSITVLLASIACELCTPPVLSRSQIISAGDLHSLIEGQK